MEKIDGENKCAASFIIKGNTITDVSNLDKIKGITATANQTKRGLEFNIKIKEDVVLNNPIYCCAGNLKETEIQNIKVNIKLEKKAKARFLSRVILSQIKNFTHNSTINIVVEEDASMEFIDVHIHPKQGKININTRTNAKVKKRGSFKESFIVVEGRAGKLNGEVNLDLEERAVGNLLSKIKGCKDDVINMKERANLNGAHSKATIKTTTIALDETKANNINIIHGNAPYSKGHIECNEITKGDKINVKTEPILNVVNDLAEITHEASIGRINKKQLETLEAKGLSEQEATEFIINGLIK